MYIFSDCVFFESLFFSKIVFKNCQMYFLTSRSSELLQACSNFSVTPNNFQCQNEICCIWTDKQLTIGGSETLLRFQQCILIDLQVREREVSSFCRLPMKLPKNLFVQNSLQSSVKKDYLFHGRCQ